MELAWEGPIIEWRGPAPYFYIAMPPDQADALEPVAASVSYGWGVIPVAVRIGSTAWTTSLFPKDGTYLVPVKDKIRKAERLALGDVVDVCVTVDV